MIAKPLHNMVKKELTKVGMNRKIREGVQGAKREVYKRTSVSYTRFRQKNKDGSRHTRLCYEKGIIYRRKRWEMVTSSFSLEISK